MNQARAPLSHHGGDGDDVVYGDDIDGDDYDRRWQGMIERKNDQKDQEDDQTYQIIVKVGVDRSSWSWLDKIALIHDLQPLNPA